MDEFPLVTVFTLIYNTNPRYVIEAIESVRANNYPNIQHIIIDDCSPNPVPKRIVKEWIEREKYPCEFYEHDVNYGVCKTLNHVLELTKGKYLLGCSDDILTSNRIWEDVQILDGKCNQYAIVFGMSQFVDSNAHLKYHVIPELNDTPVDDNYFINLLEKNVISAPSVTFRTHCINSVGGFDENLPYEDYEMWLRLSHLGFKFASNPRINCFYRMHSESMTSNFNTFQVTEFTVKLKFSHLNLVKQKLKDELILLGSKNVVLQNQLYDLYKKKHSSEFKLTIASLNVNIGIKLVLLKVLSFFKL